MGMGSMIAALQEKEMLRMSRRWCPLDMQTRLTHHGSSQVPTYFYMSWKLLYHCNDIV